MTSTIPAPTGEHPAAPGAAAPAAAPVTPLRVAIRLRVRGVARTVGAQVWRYARPLLHAVRPLGWVAIGAAVVAYLLASAYGWFEFTVLAVAFAAALVVAIVSAVGRAHYRVALDLSSNRVQVGEKAAGQMSVTNTSRRRLLPARIELPIGVGAASFPLPSLRGGETHDETFLVPTQRRAVIPVGPARSVRGDALGLIRRVVRWTEPGVIYVHPRTVLLGGAMPGFLKDLEGEPTDDLSNDDVSFHALRPYLPGDDRRYIDWKTSARTLMTRANTLMVRQFEETRRSHVTVTLPTRRDEYATDSEFELAVSIAASLATQALREGRQLSVHTSTAALPAVVVRAMLDAFSGVDRADADLATPLAARDTVRAAPDVSVAFLVVGSAVAATLLRSAASAFPLGARVVAIRADEAAPVALSRIAGTPVLTVGALDDLYRGLKQAVAHA